MRSYTVFTVFVAETFDSVLRPLDRPAGILWFDFVDVCDELVERIHHCFPFLATFSLYVAFASALVMPDDVPDFVLLPLECGSGTRLGRGFPCHECARHPSGLAFVLAVQYPHEKPRVFAVLIPCVHHA